MKYKVKIGTPNKMFYIRGKLVRSPVEWVANESELEGIRIKITSEGIMDFSIEPYDSSKKSQTKSKLTLTPPIKEEKKSKPKKKLTTLDKLMVS